MKKIICLSFIFFLAVGITVAQKKRVAIVTFFADKYINANKTEEDFRKVLYEKTREEDPRFDLRPVLKDFHEMFMNKSIKEFPFEFVPEKEIIGNPKYKAFNGFYELETQEETDEFIEAFNDRFIPVDGYNVLLTGGNMIRAWRTESLVLDVLGDNDIDGILFVSISYALEPQKTENETDNIGIRSYINMDLFDKEAKKVFKLEEFATSTEAVALASEASAFNYDKLMPMCAEATEAALDDLNTKLPKYVKKAYKKL